MIEGNYLAEAKCCDAGLQMKAKQWNPTVAENIDAKIAQLKAEIERLEQSKIDMAPLMNMRINDIRSAMNY